MTEEQSQLITIDGPIFCGLVRAGLFLLDKHSDYVNALNVFPVPDGDTGTNMLLTMRSAEKGLKNCHESASIGKLAKAVSRGALMGARGNSGVILSQIWRGFANVVGDKETINATDFAAGWQEAADTAYRGVMKPVEGTILTVVREAAEEAVMAAAESDDILVVLNRTLARAQLSLANTPEQLPILKQAGVVDSGGQGLVYIWEGMVQWLRGELDMSGSAETTHTPFVSAQELARPEDGQIENPYDVQFILLGENLNVTEVRNRIDAMGDSTVVVGDENAIKVHIHVEDPGEPLSYGISLGVITDIVVENMQLQMEEMIADSGQKPADQPTLGSAPAPVEMGQIGVVAVSPGHGLTQIFHGLGVSHVVDGGQTNNPSTEEILHAIDQLPTDTVVVLPNNKNIILAAETACELSAKQVTVVPSRTVPQGIAALMCLQPDGALDEVSAEMQEAMDDVISAAVTIATRDVTLNGVEVANGNFIGIVNGKICAAGQSSDAILPAVCKAMALEDCELLTLYYGSDVNEQQTLAIAERIEALYPDVETDCQNGGQAHYHFILGAE